MVFIKNYINIFLILIIIDFFSFRKLDKNFVSFTDDEEIITINSDNETEFVDAIEKLNEKGGTIFIDTPIINLNETTFIRISGSLSGGIIGIKQSNEEYPRINFNKENEALSGIIITGTNKFLEHIIVENAPFHGVSIIGNNNILDHVISRYNFGSGFAIRGDFNTLNYCYAYRNCGSSMYLINADGFQISGDINNVFNYCFAWDNSNSGFNYVKILNSTEFSFLHSGSWNNGNINVFTGNYDYENGSPLDKNLWTIQEIMKSDPSFISNYYNKKYNIDNAKLEGISVKEWISKVSPILDGNGFTFENINSSQSIDVKRNALYCVSFDHKAGGFIDNYNHRYNAYITNCVAFSNDINYKLPYIFSKWSNNWSWGSKNSDQLNKDVITKKPNNINTARRLFDSVRNQIVKAVYNNMFPDGVNFDSSINRLTE